MRHWVLVWIHLEDFLEYNITDRKGKWYRNAALSEVRIISILTVFRWIFQSHNANNQAKECERCFYYLTNHINVLFRYLISKGIKDTLQIVPWKNHQQNFSLLLTNQCFVVTASLNLLHRKGNFTLQFITKFYFQICHEQSNKGPFIWLLRFRGFLL